MEEVGERLTVLGELLGSFGGGNGEYGEVYPKNLRVCVWDCNVVAF